MKLGQLRLPGLPVCLPHPHPTNPPPPTPPHHLPACLRACLKPGPLRLPALQGMDVALVCDGSGAGRGGGEKKDVLPPLMPGMKPRQQA